MEHYIPYARSDASSSQVDALVEWLGVDRLLGMVNQLPPETEFAILLDFLVEFAGALELAEHRMAETLVEQSAISYKAHAEVVKIVKRRLTELYNDAAINCSKDESICQTPSSQKIEVAGHFNIEEQDHVY